MRAFLLFAYSSIIGTITATSSLSRKTAFIYSRQCTGGGTRTRTLPVSFANADDESPTSTTFVRESRAGEDGFSLLRRPVTFDPEKDVSYAAPKLLDEEEEEDLRNSKNRLWFEERTSSSNEILGDFAIGNPDTPEQDPVDHNTLNVEDQNIDMHQRTLDTLDYPVIQRALADECETQFARNLITKSMDTQVQSRDIQDTDADVLTMPITASSVEGVHSRYGAVQEMQRLMGGQITGFWSTARRNALKHKISSSSRGISNKKKVQRLSLGTPPIDGYTLDIESIMSIIDEGKVLEGPEILDVSSMMELCLDVLDWSDALEEWNRDNVGGEESEFEFELQQEPFVQLPSLVKQIHMDEELIELLATAFDEEGKLSGTTFPSIGRLRSKIRTLKRGILSSIESILALPSMRNKLAVESGGSLMSEINGRIVIPVQQQYSSVGIVHDASRSGKTSYVEPSEVVQPTNELRSAESELRAEEAKVWRQLTESIVKHREEIERNVASLGQLDVVKARVKLGRRLDGTVPEVKNEGVVSAIDAKHPILLLRGMEVVGSDVEIGQGKNQAMILTGPNAGGKTIILKLLGLFAMMARDGIPVPTKQSEKARVDFFEPVLADIGDIQSVDADLSTFSGHMLVCREVLNDARKDALVLLDEPGSGTDPNQGVAIAQALLEALLDRGCRVAITTHFLDLKQLASSDDRFAVAGMQFLGNRPTYKLIPGMIGESFALAVAERLKLPASVLDRANGLLDSETRKMGELLRDLEEQKQEVEKTSEALKKKEFEMLELKAEMRSQQEKLEAKQLNARRDEAARFSKKLEEKEKILEGILERLQGSGATKKVIADSWTELRIVKREVMSEAENVPGSIRQLNQLDEANVELIPISELKGINKVEVGKSVVVCKKGAFYGKDATVKKLGKKLELSVGGMPVRLSLKEIAFPPSSGRGQTPVASNKQPNQKQISKMAQRALDLDEGGSSSVDASSGSTRDKGTSMKTKSNTVDCLGLNFEESKRKCINSFSKAAMGNRSVVYILHGHGTGVLKRKIREWLKNERQFVKSFKPADQADGGDALTRVELKRQNLF